MTPEKQIENQLRHRFEQAGGYIIKTFAAPNVNKGIPDLIGVLNGHFCAFEVKRPTGGQPTPVQLRHLKAIAQAGGYAFVTNDPNLIDALIAVGDQPRQLLGDEQTIVVPVDANDVTDYTPTQARHLWQDIKGPHSIQFI